MTKPDIRSELLDRIYESALMPEKWAAALDAMASELGADLFHLVGWDERSQTDLLGVREGAARCSEVGRYRSYHQETPTIQRVAEWAGGTPVFAWNRAFCTGVRPAEAHCRYFLCGDEMPHMLGRSVLRKGATCFEVGFLRCYEKGPFSVEAQAVFEGLCSHLQRALCLGLAKAKALSEWPGRISAPALEATALGVVALDRAGQLRYTNGRGEALLRGGGNLRLVEGRLKGGDAKLDAALGSALQRVRSERRPVSVKFGGGLCMTAMPLPFGGFLGLGKDDAVLLLLTEVTHQRIATARQLIELFGLTPAEARLARALAQGETVESHAVGEGVGLPTVRAHLSKVFAKTGTDRQGALVKLLAGIPVVRI